MYTDIRHNHTINYRGNTFCTVHTSYIEVEFRFIQSKITFSLNREPGNAKRIPNAQIRTKTPGKYRWPNLSYVSFWGNPEGGGYIVTDACVMNPFFAIVFASALFATFSSWYFLHCRKSSLFSGHRVQLIFLMSRYSRI